MEKENEIIESPKVSKLTEASKESLLAISKWGNFMGIFSIVSGALGIVANIKDLVSDPLVGLIGIIFSVITILIAAKLIKGAKEIKKAVSFNDKEKLELGLQQMALTFKWYYIYILTCFILVALFLVCALVFLV